MKYKNCDVLPEVGELYRHRPSGTIVHVTVKYADGANLRWTERDGRVCNTVWHFYMDPKWDETFELLGKYTPVTDKLVALDRELREVVL